MRASVIGLGVMGQNHARVLRAMGLDVTTIDTDDSKGADYRSVFQAPPSDVAVVATPAGTLPTVAVAAAATTKLLMVEKPFAATINGANQIIETATNYGVRIGVNFTERCNPALEVLRDNLHLVGGVTSIRVQRFGLPGRTFIDPGLDLATHDLDAIRFLGYEPTVTCACVADRHAYYALDLDGALGVVDATDQTDVKVRRMVVEGPDGMLDLNYQAQSVLHYHADGVTPLPVSRVEPLSEQWRRFLAGEPVATAEDAVAVLKLALSRVPA